MTMPRRQLVDVAVPRYYHCISRCVRRAFLCGEGVTHRKAWIEARLELLAKHFAVSVCGFAILVIVSCKKDSARTGIEHSPAPHAAPLAFWNHSPLHSRIVKDARRGTLLSTTHAKHGCWARSVYYVKENLWLRTRA